MTYKQIILDILNKHGPLIGNQVSKHDTTGRLTKSNVHVILQFMVEEEYLTVTDSQTRNGIFCRIYDIKK